MHVSQLNIYPIKSCGGIALDAAPIGARGFVNDRRWLLIDSNNRFLTQRELPRMALIQPALDADCLRLTAPNVGGIELPLDQPGARVEVSVWKDSGIGAIDQGDQVAEWFSTFLGQDCRLVRFADDAVRPVSPKYAPRPTDQVGFADGYPFLFISEASLDGSQPPSRRPAADELFPPERRRRRHRTIRRGYVAGDPRRRRRIRRGQALRSLRHHHHRSSDGGAR